MELSNKHTYQKCFLRIDAILCNKNRAFLINLLNLALWKDILSDLHGHSNHSKTKIFRFYFNQENVFIVTEEDHIFIEETLEVQRLIYHHTKVQIFTE